MLYILTKLSAISLIIIFLQKQYKANSHKHVTNNDIVYEYVFKGLILKINKKVFWKNLKALPSLNSTVIKMQNII